MKVTVTRIGPDLDPHVIERESQAVLEQRVTFRMNGSTATLTDGGDATDLPEVVAQVEQLGFVNAVEVGE